VESSFRWRAPDGPLVPGPDLELRERWIAGALFVLTGVSVVSVHRWNVGTLWSPRGWAESAVFACTLLGFLVAHELGHRSVARAHGMTVSWPVFLPAPFFVGTLGALIRIHDRPRTRTALLEMGAGGPLAGLAVLALATVARIGWSPPGGGGETLTPPLLWSATAWILRGHAVPLTTADPVGYAIWVGCLVTAMNLLPFGQLDGGHVAVAAWPERARLVSAGVAVALAVGGFAWWGWWAWLVAIVTLARRPMTVVAPGAPPTPRARLAAAAAIAAWALCFTPSPW
jgi:membrane-associated protease RseP (regulator of RpoE activity)